MRTRTTANGRRTNRNLSKATVCLNSCRALFRRLDGLKDQLLKEFGGKLKEQDRLLRAALNEAEALAWQTPYPHLFFPVLAEEKAVSAHNWAQRQREIRQASLRFAA